MNQAITPIRPPPPPSEVEPKLLGALLDLPDQLTLMEGCGLTVNDFTDRRVALCWNIARRMAEKRRQVNALTVFSAGKTARVMDDSIFAWLQQLQATNSITRESFMQVAENLRLEVRGRQVAARLDEISRELRGGSFNASQVGRDLEALQFSLSGEDLQDETADSDIVDLMDSWDSREKTGKTALIPTGIKVLDDLIGGWDFRLNVIFGLPGTGKNALIGGIIDAQLAQDETLHSGLFGLEDGSEWFTKRLVARDLDMPVRDVGSKARTADQMNHLINVVAPGLHPRLQRLHVYRRDEIKVEDWLHVATHWVRNRGVRCLYLDNLGQMDHTQFGFKDDQRMGVARTVKAFARFAIRHQVPVVLLAHSSRAADDGERPPKMSEIQDSAFVERRARKIIGVWTKNRELRATILKDQEGSGGGTTLELGRFVTAALVDPASGKSVDLRQEAREDRKEKDHERATRHLAAAELRTRLKAERTAKATAEAAANAPPPPPQLDLLADPPKVPNG